MSWSAKVTTSQLRIITSYDSRHKGYFDCSETFCVSKKWWDDRPLNSDGKYDLLTNHWGHYFNRIREEGKIEINTLNMADNYLCYLHCHHLLRHGDRIFPYFYFENMKFVKDRIRGISRTNMDKFESKIKEVVAEKSKSLEAEKRKRVYTSVQFADF